MKRTLLVIALMVGMTSAVWADLAGQRVQDLLIQGLSQIRASSSSLYSSLNTIKGKIQDLITANTGTLDATDKTKLNIIKNDLTAVIAALNTLVTDIDVNYPDINQ